MEIIGLILFVLFFIISASSKNKKGNSAAQRPGTAGNAKQQASAANARSARPKPSASKVKPVRPASARPKPSASKVKPVRPASAMPKNLGDLKAAMNQWLEDSMTEIKGDVKPVVQPAAQSVQGASMLEDAQCAGGSMPHVHDEGHSTLVDEDCAGGSMEHTHTEGVSRAAQARRMAAIDAGHDEDVLPETIDARALRRAVVMAEVLGKPRALKKF